MRPSQTESVETPPRPIAGFLLSIALALRYPHFGLAAVALKSYGQYAIESSSIWKGNLPTHGKASLGRPSAHASDPT